MSEIKALGKLRKLAICDKGEKYTVYLDAENIADEIEAEITEKYMLLPVDADGVPIHIDDRITSDGENRLHVARLELRSYGWAVCCDGFCYYSPANTHHVKLRTIEDVLRDLEGMRGNNATYEDVVRCCSELAAEIRELIGEGE